MADLEQAAAQYDILDFRNKGVTRADIFKALNNMGATDRQAIALYHRCFAELSPYQRSRKLRLWRNKRACGWVLPD